jgi:hypothetical protein
MIDDDAFERMFRKGTLDPALFSHEAHLRLAWIHIRKYGVEKAIDRICRQIIDFAAQQGAAQKYNKTVTIAAVRAVDHFIRKQPIESFQEFIETHPRLKYNFRELLGHHYQFDIFKSERARQEYLEPDLLPFT